MISFQPAQKIESELSRRYRGFLFPREVLSCRSPFARTERSARKRKMY